MPGPEGQRWQKIEELYHAALETEAEKRATLLAQADPEVRREVESLLGQQTAMRCYITPRGMERSRLKIPRKSRLWRAVRS